MTPFMNTAARHMPFVQFVRKAWLAATLSTVAFVALAQALPMAEGEVRRIDKASGKIALKHGEIKNLDMPPMSMVFQVKDKAMLDNIKAGDKVNFTVDQVNGDYTVMSIEVRK